MKKIRITYWIFTGLLAAMMLFSAIPNIMATKQSVDIITTHMGYPEYFIVFIGIAKLLGVVAIVMPGVPRLKEWAYAGFTFDLVAVIYSFIALGDPIASWSPMFIFFIILAGSYLSYHRLKKAKYQEGLHAVATIA